MVVWISRQTLRCEEHNTVYIQYHSHPNVASTKREGIVFDNVLVFGVTEGPEFYAIDETGVCYADSLMVVFNTGFTCVDQHLLDGVKGDTHRPTDRLHGHAYDLHPNYHNSFIHQ